MSSPLSSLKKGNRNVNLPGHISGHRPIPFRHPEYSEDESKLLEEITTNMVASRLKARDPFSVGVPTKMEPSSNPSLVMNNTNSNNDDEKPSSSESVLPPPSDHELMKLMMARLAIMEQTVQKQEQEIKVKDRRNKILEDKLSILHKARDEDGNAGQVMDRTANNANNSQKRVQDLEQHCLLLQQQVHEMETFLADYGMVWIGEQDDPSSDLYLSDDQCDEQVKKQQEAAGLKLTDVTKVPNQPFKIDFNLLFDNIRDLNIIAGKDEARVQHTTDGARLRRQTYIPITFYANGFIMFEGPFRPYTEPSTLQCMKDFLDGYFPSELQSRYPEGVPFAVQNMHEVSFQPKKGVDVFSGIGNVLGGEKQPSRLIPSNLRETDKTRHAITSSDSNSTVVASQPPFQPRKVETFLHSLPKSVVRDGKVIDIRDSIGKTLSGETSGEDKAQVSVVQTSVTKAMQKALSETGVDRPKTPRDITTLRIKSEWGSHTYIVKMRFKETMGDLRRYLDTHREGETTEYDIWGSYPRKMFADDRASMEVCGLVPNGVLHLQAKKKT